MAYVSFTLRKQTSGFGSYLQQAGALDSGLQSGGISSATVITSLTTGTNTFTANILSNGTVRLEWTLAEELVETVTSGVQPTELRIISSASGEPVTIRDGVFIKNITSDTLDTFYDDQPEVAPGRWVYYALFAKYSNGTDYWYTRVATLYIQIPIQYQSVESLWSKVPEYYRTADYAQETLESGNHPLYSFLELFGNEVDRTRTLIESVAISNDPEIAVTPALSELAYETGLEITVDDLGASKVRTLLSNIGTLRQKKGTIGSICSYISAMTGCPVTYTYNAALPKPHVFNVYAQRVNFISDPEFANVTITTSSGTVTQNGTTYYSKLQTTNTWGVYTYGTDTLGASNPSITFNGNGMTVAMPNGTYANRTVMLYPRKPFPYLGTNTYGTSYNYVGTSGASFAALRTATNTTRLAWESGIVGASMPTTLFADDAWYANEKYAYSSTTSRPSIDYPSAESRTNLVTNPSFETDLTGWSVLNGTTIVKTTTQSLFGTSSIQVTNSTLGNSGINSIPPFTVTAGQTYTASGYMKTQTGTIANMSLFIVWLDSAQLEISRTLSAYVTGTTSWQRLSVTGTAPVGTAFVSLRFSRGLGDVAGTIWYADGLLLETGSTLKPYFESTTIPSATTVSSVPVLVFNMAPGSSITLDNWLFEPSTNGDYFSGRTREGGYIPIQDGTVGGGTFDYYWDTAGADQAYSYYLQDHERTIKTTERVIGQYIVPVTMLALYSIVWDYYPGK